MKSLIKLIVILCITFNTTLNAQVTFNKDIAPIIYDNCTSCHREGEIGPMPLTNYEEISAWGSMIEYVTQSKYMPPWKPNPTYSHFVGERGLTDDEIQLIADWVSAGTPEGDPALRPEVPLFPDGSQLGTPDVILEMKEEYFIEGNNEDDYRVFVLPSGFIQDREIAAVEFRPGNRSVVHHALIGFETAGRGAALDASNDGYGYESFGDFGVPVDGMLTTYTPGIQSLRFPQGIGTVIPANADILIQVHYAPLASDETDQSSLNIFFKDSSDPVVRPLQRMPITPFDLVGGAFTFQIPPNEITKFHGIKDIEEDISLISIYPHCHYLGRDWLIYAITPENDTINIIQIEDWDFNWQGDYTFERMKKIPAGSELHVFATYDNTSDNPLNPNFPPQHATWGEGTTDEMFLIGTTYVSYQEGDENISLGDPGPTSIGESQLIYVDQLFPPYPNPTTEMININYSISESRPVDLSIIDLNGKLIESILSKERQKSGEYIQQFRTANLSEGTYFIRLEVGNKSYAESFVVNRR